jgi:glutamyl-tRNA reductase
MQETFKALILTSKTAPVEIREQVALNEGGVKKLLKFTKEFTQATDVLVISTCNRTEIYYSAEQDLSEELFKGLRLEKSIAPGFESHFQSLGHKEAIQHLFEVSIGLDAQVIGDLQISGQVKSAYQWSADENVAGPFLHRLMHTIFFVNKRVVQETSFRDGAATISYAAKELAETLTLGLLNPRILVLGVGEIGQDVVLNLVSAGLSNVVILNRTMAKAESLAKEANLDFGGLDQLNTQLKTADVIISSVSGQQPLVTEENLKGIEILKHKYFIDLSMPRSIDPTLESISGVEVYNLDDLRNKTNEALQKRKSSIPKVEATIGEAIDEFNDWSREMILSPTIQKIKNALEQIRKEELARFIKNADTNEAAKLDEMSRSLMQKILKYPVLQLKAACRRGEAETLSELLLDLFDLERISEKK